MTSDRARSLVGGALGLASLVISWKARSRGRSWSVTALSIGVVAIVLSLFHLANVSGGFGTGGGKLGAIVALVLGTGGCGLSIHALCVRRFR